ncbi:MAG: hypothetical protein ACOYL3_07105 [Desulfuromonadaceae bacterium]
MFASAADFAPHVSRELELMEIADPLDQQLCEIVSAVLMRHYPLYDWLVRADRRKGMIDILNVSLDGQLGCRIFMDGPATVSGLEHKAMMYGGEILERFNVTRGTMKQQEVAELPRDFAGRITNVAKG